MTKKGQGALEYLMTYGWALLIIVVVGAALYALGVLNPATYTKSTCAGFTYFQFSDQQLQASGTYSIELYNGNQDISVVDVQVGADSNASVMSGDTTPSATEKFTLVGTDEYETLNPDKSSGDSYSYAVTITYDVIGGLSGKTDQATCTGTVQ